MSAVDADKAKPRAGANAGANAGAAAVAAAKAAAETGADAIAAAQAQAKWLSLACFALAVVAQLSNLRCHIILSNLRKPGEKAYKIPSGFLFNYITCANYTAEIWGWILFTIGTCTLAAGLFTAAGAIQMADWARGKHRRLQKLFDGQDGREKYPKRWVMFPRFL